MEKALKLSLKDDAPHAVVVHRKYSKVVSVYTVDYLDYEFFAKLRKVLKEMGFKQVWISEWRKAFDHEVTDDELLKIAVEVYRRSGLVTKVIFARYHINKEGKITVIG